MPIIISFILTLSAVSTSIVSAQIIATENLKNGDIIFQTSRSGQSRAIQLATGSRYSHMGIIFFKRNQPFVLEAIGRVSYTPLSAWIKRGYQQKFVIKRVRNTVLTVDNAVSIRLLNEAKQFVGKPYDLLFEWSDKKIYCSELVWKIYYRATKLKIGPQKKLSDFNLTHPIVRKKLVERYGSKLPLHTPVISPADMFNSKLLKTIQ